MWGNMSWFTSLVVAFITVPGCWRVWEGAGDLQSQHFYWQGFGDMILLRVDVKTRQAVGDVFLLTRVLCGPVFNCSKPF